MGLYDREYYRGDEPGSPFGGSERMLVTNLVLVNLAIFVADLFSPTTGPESHWLSDWMACHSDSLWRPWMWWQFLTYGFAHSPADIKHIGWNMFALWMFGRDVEQVYGRKEFLRIYLVAIVFCGVVWAVVETLQSGGQPAAMIGASGGMTAVLILFALNFPQRQILLFFVIPAPAWVLAVLIVVGDLLGATGYSGGGGVAFTAHLAGAAFAVLYFRGRWNLGRLAPGGLSWPRLGSRPKLRVHRPSEDGGLDEKVDRILDKINREGEASLTKQERRVLEDASRRFQNRRR